jgi:hypothetical protein
MLSSWVHQPSVTPVNGVCSTAVEADWVFAKAVCKLGYTLDHMHAACDLS